MISLTANWYWFYLNVVGYKVHTFLDHYYGAQAVLFERSGI